MRLRAAVLLLAGAVLVGCGGSGETKTVTRDGAGAAPGPRTTTGPEAAASGASGEQGAAAAGPALAGRDGQVDGIPVRLELAELKRTSGTTALGLRLTTTSEDRAQVAGTFDDGIFQESTAPDADSVLGGSTLDGVYLVDGTNRKKYLIGRDAQNLCTCDGDLGSAFVNADAPLTLSATFGAPPADVRAVDVFVPRFGTFKDVPLG